MTAAPIAAATPAHAAGTTLGQRALAEAQKHYGQPYKYGAAGPTRFDCSGFTMYVFSRLGRSLPHSSAAQYNAKGVRHIDRKDVRPGDLVFTIRSGSIRHVAIYAGSNAMWAATETGDVVRKQPLSGRTLVFGRVG
jgi:cell wall-associated NlpC family hydrolase